MAYERDILDEPRRPKVVYPQLTAATGLVAEDRATGFCGDVVKTSSEAVTLRARNGEHRHFRWKPGGFLIDGKPVTLVRPVTATDAVTTISNSGSLGGSRISARVARAGRIMVEGIHDAELVEHVWGDDLREAGIVVEPLGGIDHLADVIAELSPSPRRRLGVLVDHLVAGSKEARLAATIRDPNVLITGHPFVDVWAAINPQRVGLEAWPDVPRGIPWKEGLCRQIGAGDPAAFWKHLRNKVRNYADLDPTMVGAVERLIDFVTEIDE